ncbi:MAG: fibronectin type III domain-containing protein [Oscillospiraceae bacterium]|nr:fibronectin type III domain-containing protein [Oscillospiraceae bacterium]
MKKLLAIILAGLMLISCMSLTAIADDGQASLEVTSGDGKVTLTWEDSGLESYPVYYKRATSDEWKLAGTTTKNKVSITGLVNGIVYDFRIGFGEKFSETVKAVPMGEVVALLEHFGDEYSAYAVCDSEASDILRLAYESIEYNTTGAEGELGSDYYKISVFKGLGMSELFIDPSNLILLDGEYLVPNDGTDYYSMISGVADSLIPGISFEMPCSAENLEFITVSTDEFYPDTGEHEGTWNFVENPQSINSLIAMYCALEYITVPTDEEMVEGVWEYTTTVGFEIDGVRCEFTIDQYSTVTWSTVDSNYKFVDENIRYLSTIGRYLSGTLNAVFYKGIIPVSDNDSEISGTATVEIGKDVYEITDPDDLDNLRIIYESLGLITEANDEEPGETGVKVTLTVDGEEVKFSVSEDNIVTIGDENFSITYGTDYYSTLTKIAENTGLQYRAVNLHLQSSKTGSTDISITDEEDIMYLVSLFENLPEITDPTDEFFHRPNYFVVSYRDNGTECEFYINSYNLVMSDSLGTGTYTITDGNNYYSEIMDRFFEGNM